MRLLPMLAVGLASLFLGTNPSRADTKPASPSPVQLIPDAADFLIEVPQPKHLAEVLGKLEVLARVQKLAVVQEQLDATSARRARQLLAYFEKKLGAKWPVVLEKLAGDGAALGAKFGPNAPAVLVLRGRDEKLAQQFLDETATVLQGELERQESKDRVDRGDYHGMPGFRVGTGLWMARAGTALVISNKKEAMAAALHLHLGKGGKSLHDHPGWVDARKQLPHTALARLWINLLPVQKSEGGKALYKTPRDNPALTVLFGGYLDILGRAPWLAAALVQEKDGFLFTLRAPRGRDGMGADRDLHLPPAGQPVSRPLLTPPGVMYSSSFYLDIARIWTDRARLFPRAQADGLTQFDKGSGRILAGIRLSNLLESAGAHHRLVVVNQAKTGYARKPRVMLPAFAFVPELRQPEKFGRSIDTLLRTLALFATGTFKMELAETKHHGVEIVGYRFDEKAEVKEDVNDIRFNFSPCFARVGKQFVFCSSMELCRELIDLLQAEAKQGGKGDRGYGRDRFFAAGIAAFLKAQEDALVTQTILDRAVPPGEAREQVQALLALLRGLGVVSSSSHFDEKAFRYEFRTRAK